MNRPKILRLPRRVSSKGVYPGESLGLRANESVCFIGGAGHSGSTLLGLLLGSHSRGFYVGEGKKTTFLDNPKNPERKRVCKLCGPECPVWGGFQRDDSMDIYEQVSRKVGKPLLIDSTKDVAWIHERSADVRTAGGRTCLVFLRRDGRAILNSRMHKYPDRLVEDHVQAWLDKIAETEVLFEDFVGPKIKVEYETLATDPERVLRRLCTLLEVEYEPMMLDYRAAEHHPLGGNNGTQYLVARAKNEQEPFVTLTDRTRPYYGAHSGEIVLDTRWKNELPAEALNVFTEIAGAERREVRSGARVAKKKVELVFRTVGERTANLSLELAKRHIRPDRVHIIDNVRPFSAAVDEMLRIDHDCDIVVHMDADALILEDMRPFLNWNARPYVDCYVHDRFRGQIHCGVHICRIDIVKQMREIEPPANDLAYVLRPESRLRNLVMRKIKVNKAFKNFRILHDHFQSYESIFEKYALRELRSRTIKQRARLDSAMTRWPDEPDYIVARAAVVHAQRNAPSGTSVEAIARYIADLPRVAQNRVRRLELPPQGSLTQAELNSRLAELGWAETNPKKPKVFGLGLSRTGTRSLTAGLHILGWDVIHYPTDARTLAQLCAADYRFWQLEHYDGLTDITVAPFYPHLDRLYPGSKFALTLRDKASWLKSCRNHWTNRPAFYDDSKSETHMRMRRLLRAATYGCYEFDEKRFAWVYDEHVRRVREHFRDRPDQLLELNVVDGDGFRLLANFLGVPVPSEPFPHKGGVLSKDLAELEVLD